MIFLMSKKIVVNCNSSNFHNSKLEFKKLVIRTFKTIKYSYLMAVMTSSIDRFIIEFYQTTVVHSFII